jgi:hypothetical protein
MSSSSKPVVSQELIDSLDKGSVIPCSEVMEIMGVSIDNLPDPEVTRFAALKLVGYIEQALWNRELFWSVQVTKSHGVAILTDAEAVIFRARQHKRGRKAIHKSARGQAGIDHTKLDDATKKLHELELFRVSATSVALKRKIADVSKFKPVKSEVLDRRQPVKPVTVNYSRKTSPQPPQGQARP